jgi:hypothetical protein
MDGGRFPRLDEAGNQLPGHGIYPLTGDDLTDYNSRLAAAAANALPNAIQGKLVELEAVRHIKQYSNVTYGGNTYNAGQTARANLTAMLLSFDLSVKTDDFWLDTDNNQVILTKIQFQELFDTVFASQQNAYMTESTKHQEISALTTVAAVDAYDINAGW